MINPCYAIQLGDNKFAERGWYYVIATSEKNAGLKLARQCNALVNGRLSRKALNIVDCHIHHKGVIY